MPKKCLVTGAAGFIGSHVVDHLLNSGHDVVALDDLSGGFKDNVHQDATFINGSINDTTLLSQIFQEYQFDYVYHLAAYAAEGLSHFIRRFNYENNLLGSVNLINESVKHNVKCFIFTSSIAVYGTNQLPMTEDMTPSPEDPYGIAKYAIELDLKAANEMFGLDYIVFRPHNVYGERQNIGDTYRNVVGIFMNRILQGNDITIFGDGNQTRAFSYIDDVAPVIAHAVENKKAYGETFNIGADTPYTINELAQTVMDVMNKKVDIVHAPARNEVTHAHSSHDKIARYFPYKKPTSLQDGITRMARWVERHGARKTQKFENIELTQNLPPSWR